MYLPNFEVLFMVLLLHHFFITITLPRVQATEPCQFANYLNPYQSTISLAKSVQQHSDEHTSR